MQKSGMPVPTGTLFGDSVDTLTADLCRTLEALPLEQKVDALNRVRQALHGISPFAAEPVDCVLWVPVGQVQANDYNPNSVAPPEMRLLARSIAEDGYTQPVVTFAEGPAHTVVDGFHRTRVARENPAVRARIQGYLPVTIINEERTGLKERMAATIRHNRARGVHGVLPMTEIVAGLLRQGWNDTEIAQELGMEADEVLRFKQNKGLPELFRDTTYSRAWE